MLDAHLKRPDSEEKQPVEPETFSLVQSDDQLEETENDKSVDQKSPESQEREEDNLCYQILKNVCCRCRC